MSNGVQTEQNEPVTAAAPPQSEGSVATYNVVPFADKGATKDDLYGFRAAMAAHQAEAEEQKPKEKPKSAIWIMLLLVALLGTGAALLFFGVSKVVAPKQPALYIDLGTQRFDPAGLGGRFIARWSDGASFQFFIDPLDEDRMPGFQAVAENPPHSISFNVRLLDSSGAVACQKDILIPPINGAEGSTDHAQALAPRQTSTGDTVQNTANRDGQITEMVISGSLPCSLAAYRHIVSWDFSSNFPNLDEQANWIKHEKDLASSRNPHKSSGVSYGPYTLVKSLPVPIEGDDVIVSDNPARGIVETGGGRVFLVGASVLTNRALDWQSFPASVHFRCERNAICMVTRLNSRTAVHAHLLR